MLVLAGGCGAPASVTPIAPGHSDEALAAVSPAAAAAAGAALTAPAGCTEVTFDTLKNGAQLSPALFSKQPTGRGNLTTSIGDPALADGVRVRIDAASGWGLHSLANANADLAACDHCVYVFEDLDPKTGASAREYVAQTGSMLLARVTGQETAGAVLDVKLLEVTEVPGNVPYRHTTIVPGGRCLWIRAATWNTIRDRGCDPTLTPRIGALGGPGLTCVAEDAAGADGTWSVATGSKRDGESCAPGTTRDGAAQSDCGAGYACSDLTTSDGSSVCLRTCDILAAQPGCPSGSICGQFGLCIPADLYSIDPAPVGQLCGVRSFFCGSEGARGMCVNIDGGEPTGLCVPVARARSSCKPGELGYSLVNNGADASLGFCYTPAK